MNCYWCGKFFSFIKSAAIEGIFFILPFGLIFIIAKFAINFISKILQPIHYFLPDHILNIPYIEVLIGFIIAVILGIIIHFKVINKIIHFFEINFIKHIPAIGSLYFAIKRIVESFRPPKKNEIDNQRVAWVKVPAKNMYCLGLMTSVVQKHLSPEKNKTYYCFFVPHTPNPISGYYVVVPEEECVFVEISRQEALSIIMSAGVVQPK